MTGEIFSEFLSKFSVASVLTSTKKHVQLCCSSAFRFF